MYKDILSLVDHTMLSQTTTWEEIKKLCDEAKKYNVASVCIPPSFVKEAKIYLESTIKVCTVIGFPNGYNTTKVKVFEAEDAINNGADEIDMVINLGMVKEKKYDEIVEEIKLIKETCKDKILKVIIETSLLNEEEKVKLCSVITEAKADFIKTSTGFSTGGAVAEDIVLFKNNIGKDVEIKAAGGIKDLDTARDFIDKGASRLGTSSIINIINKEHISGY